MFVLSQHSATTSLPVLPTAAENKNRNLIGYPPGFNRTTRTTVSVELRLSSFGHQAIFLDFSLPGQICRGSSKDNKKGVKENDVEGRISRRSRSPPLLERTFITRSNTISGSNFHTLPTSQDNEV